MDVQLISDEVTPKGRVVVVDVRGATSADTHEVVDYIRKTWGAPATGDVFGDGDYPRDGVKQWEFTFVEDPVEDRLEPVTTAG